MTATLESPPAATTVALPPGHLACASCGIAVSVHRARNLAASPLRFEVDGLEVHRTIETIEDGGAALGAIYHSHTRSQPYPSQTDINFAAGWPGVQWLIVGLRRDSEPQVRCYRIDDGVVTEIEVHVDGR